MTMAEGSYSLSDDSMRVAEAGIRGMINATTGATIASYLMITATSCVMIETALHILEELEGLLWSFIDCHRAAEWLPDPHRIDNLRYFCRTNGATGVLDQR